MSTALTALVFRGTRRIRLFFTGALAAGAFTSTSLYTVTNADGATASPAVDEVYAIIGSPGAVELSVSLDLAPGALYTVTCTNVPCADLTNYSGSLQARTSQPTAGATNVEPATQDVDVIFYGRDLVYDGNDIVEDPTGDLATIAGRENWRGAMGRRMAGSPLPWDPTYSPDAEQYVDAPEPLQTPFAGRLLAQARADDRTQSASVEIVQDPNDLFGFAFVMSIVGVDDLDPIALPVSLPSSS